MKLGDPFMHDKRGQIALGTCIITALVAFGVTAGTALPQKTDKTLPKQQAAAAAGEDDAKRLVLLMDTNKNGKVSKQEFMSFMSAEFDRLDKDKSGELTLDELRQYQVGGTPIAVGK